MSVIPLHRIAALAFLSVTLLGVEPLAAAELLVGNKSADTLWRLSLEDGRRLGEIATGDGPHEVVVSGDGRRAVVTNYGAATAGNSLTVVDLATAAARTVALGEHGRPHGVRFLPGGQRVVVTTEAARTLVLVDLAAGRVERAVPMGDGRGHMVALSGDGTAAFVTKIDTGTVSRVDLAGGGKTLEREAGAGAEGVAVHPRSGEVWVSNREAGTVTVHDPDTLAVRATVPSPGFPIRVVFTDDGARALVTNARAATLSVIDANARRVERSVALARPGAEYRDTLLGRAALPIGVVAHPDGRRAYVAISGGDEIAVVDLDAGTVTARWPTGREPDALAIAPGRD